VLATVTWYATRASGVVAYLLLTSSVVFGLILSSRIHGSRPSRPWVLDVHRMLGGLAVVLTVTHVGAILIDSYTSFDLADALVPFASGWSPVAVAAGVLALWMLAAVEVTSLLRQRLPQHVWRRVHMLSFGAFVLASAHFAAAGTDVSSPVMIVGLLGLVSTVVALTALRVARLVPIADGPARRGPAVPALDQRIAITVAPGEPAWGACPPRVK
jgi:DMSO/TMAO reductase YedYZ heme-binding membrane subunit